MSILSKYLSKGSEEVTGGSEYVSEQVNGE